MIIGPKLDRVNRPNKSKDTHHKSVIEHFRLYSFSLDFIPYFRPFFVDFQKETLSF